jgi:hypothetical protein
MPDQAGLIKRFEQNFVLDETKLRAARRLPRMAFEQPTRGLQPP